MARKLMDEETRREGMEDDVSESGSIKNGFKQALDTA